MANRSQPLLRIPKVETPAVLSLSGGERSNVVLYLPPGGDLRDLLEANDRFVPIHFRSGTGLVARHAIVWVSVNVMYMATREEIPGERQQVLLHLRDNTQVSGELRWVAPVGRRRTLDHLNNEARFFGLHDGNHVTFVAKDYVVRLEEL